MVSILFYARCKAHYYILCTVYCNSGYLHILIIINNFISSNRCKTYLYYSLVSITLRARATVEKNKEGMDKTDENQGQTLLRSIYLGIGDKGCISVLIKV